MKSRFIDFIPLISSLLIENGNVGQLYKMWRYHTAAGQNVWSYVAVTVALTLWLFYHKAKGGLLAFWVTVVGIINLLAIVVTILILNGGV